MRWTFCALLIAAWGCAAGANSIADSESALTEASPGDPDAPPSLKVLPSVKREKNASSERIRQGLLMARDVLKTSMPEPPPDRAFSTLQQWINTTVVHWIEIRNQSVEATRYRFTQPNAPSYEERVFAHAVIGLIQEDTALALQAIPAPAELDDEPEIAQMYREVLEAQAAPFISAALVEFRECANTALDAPKYMRPFYKFCASRFARLRDEYYKKYTENARRGT
jgi:hypothetical protein